MAKDDIKNRINKDTGFGSAYKCIKGHSRQSFYLVVFSWFIYIVQLNGYYYYVFVQNYHIRTVHNVDLKTNHYENTKKDPAI